MGHLKNKSEINLDAADFLQRKGSYPSVVHCAYYSCFQLMKHIWLTNMGKSEEDLKILNEKPREGSHNALINQLKKFLTKKSLDSRTFNTEINQLKKLRIEADYGDIQIDSSKSNNLILLSKSTQKILKECL